MKYTREHPSGAKRALGILCIVLTAATLLAGCEEKKPAENKAAKAEAKPVPISAEPVIKKNMPVQIGVIGNVEAFTSVSVKTRVDGQIMKRHFVDGQDVREGELLFEIDPRDFQNRLKQAEADLARDQAQLDLARAQEGRYRILAEQGLVSQDLYAQYRNNYAAAEAKILADKALIENIKLQLEFCLIRSPVTGRVGKTMIYEGNIVKSLEDKPLVLINQITPIYVAFSVPENYLDNIRKYQARGSVRVLLTVPQMEEVKLEGKLAFIDNAVDNTTGTIKIRAVFANVDHRLWPGEFVNVSLVLYQQMNAVVIPSKAIQSGPDGSYVFVVKPDSTVEPRLVTVDRGDEFESVISKGLNVGEQVVTVGQLRLAKGTKVQLKQAQGSP